MKKITALLSFATLLCAPVCLPAQQPEQPATATPPEHFYSLRLVVEELNAAGTITNSRSYVATIGTGKTEPFGQVIKTGSRVPIVAGSYGSNVPNTQIQYIDTGVSFNIREVKETGDKLRFLLKAEISSIAGENEGGASSSLRGDPVIRQNSWNSIVVAPIGKATIVYSADDLDSKGKTQLQVTATRID